MPRATICSEFFCEPQLWQQLEAEHLPRLLARGTAFRAWSVGCYTGKEPFSLAILLDSMGHQQGGPVLATDNELSVLEQARQGGPFTLRDVDTIIPDERAKYLTGEAPSFFVRQEIRRRVEFCLSDITRDEVPGRFDLILYRNVEPFFNAATNGEVCARIFGALQPGGIMFCSSVDRVYGWEQAGFQRLGVAFFRRPDGSSP